MNGTITKTPLKIRLARTSDVKTIMEIVGQVVSEMNTSGNFQWTTAYPTRETFLKDAAERSLYVGLVNDRLLTFITLDRIQPSEYEPISWHIQSPAMVIHRFAVSQKARRSGYAHQMETFACNHTQSEGLRYIRTDTSSANTMMQNFLKRRGYQFAGRFFFPKCDNPFFCYDKLVK